MVCRLQGKSSDSLQLGVRAVLNSYLLGDCQIYLDRLQQQDDGSTPPSALPAAS